jgi:hypothetical protein
MGGGRAKTLDFGLFPVARARPSRPSQFRRTTTLACGTRQSVMVDARMVSGGLASQAHAPVIMCPLHHRPSCQMRQARAVHCRAGTTRHPPPPLKSEPRCHNRASAIRADPTAWPGFARRYPASPHPLYIKANPPLFLSPFPIDAVRLEIDSRRRCRGVLTSATQSSGCDVGGPWWTGVDPLVTSGWDGSHLAGGNCSSESRTTTEIALLHG